MSQPASVCFILLSLFLCLHSLPLSPISFTAFSLCQFSASLLQTLCHSLSCLSVLFALSHLVSPSDSDFISSCAFLFQESQRFSANFPPVFQLGIQPHPCQPGIYESPPWFAEVSHCHRKAPKVTFDSPKSQPACLHNFKCKKLKRSSYIYP